MITLTEMVEKYFDEYESAPQYKGYSQTLRQKIKPKSEVQSEFISNLQTMLIITDDPALTVKIEAMLKKFE